LGIKAGARVALVGPPDGFEAALGALPPGVAVKRQVRDRQDVIVAFFVRRADYERRLPGLTAALEPDGGLWVAWPKKASGVATDITDHAVREVALPTGLVDNKVCAIDDTWTGLRLVIRRDLRPARPEGRRARSEGRPARASTTVRS
jgi:hypothetical protein